MIGAIAISYWIAYRMQRTQSVLSFALFFTVIFLSVICAFWTLLSFHYTGSCTFIPWEPLRAATLLAASCYLFYTTWYAKLLK